MTDDTAITDRLLQLAEATDDDPAIETIVIDERDLMATTELRRLLDPGAELIEAIDTELQDDASG